MTSLYRRDKSQKALDQLLGFCEEFMLQNVQNPELFYVADWTRQSNPYGTELAELKLFIPWNWFNSSDPIDVGMPLGQLRGVAKHDMEIRWHVTILQGSITGVTVNFDGEYSLADHDVKPEFYHG